MTGYEQEWGNCRYKHAIDEARHCSSISMALEVVELGNKYGEPIKLTITSIGGRSAAAINLENLGEQTLTELGLVKKLFGKDAFGVCTTCKNHAPNFSHMYLLNFRQGKEDA